MGRTHTRTHTGLAVSLMISHAAQLTPLDSRLSPIMHHISSPGSELIKVVRGREADGTKRRRGEGGGGGGREGNRGKERKTWEREGEAGAVKQTLIGHFLCHSDSSWHWGKVGGREEREHSEGEGREEMRGRERVSEHKCSGREQRKCRGRKYTEEGGNQSEERQRQWEGVSCKRERERERDRHVRERAEEEEGRGTGERGRERGGGGDVTFRRSGVCFECMCGAQSGLKASGTPLNLHSQSSFFIPLITWLSSDQSAASPA